MSAINSFSLFYRTSLAPKDNISLFAAKKLVYTNF